MKDKVREVCIYRKGDNGEIRPRIYRRCDRDWKYEDKADFLAAIMWAFVLTFLFTLPLMQITAWFLLFASFPCLMFAVLFGYLKERVLNRCWNELYLKSKTAEQHFIVQRENWITTCEGLKNTPIGKLTTSQKERMEKLEYDIKYLDFL
jgi:hypothetical protein